MSMIVNAQSDRAAGKGAWLIELNLALLVAVLGVCIAQPLAAWAASEASDFEQRAASHATKDSDEEARGGSAADRPTESTRLLKS